MIHDQPLFFLHLLYPNFNYFRLNHRCTHSEDFMKHVSILVLLLLAGYWWPGDRYSGRLLSDVTLQWDFPITDYFEGKDGPSEDAIRWALEGYSHLNRKGVIARDELLTIIDYSLPSDQKRMWVLDVHNKKVLHHSLVAHGRNSGARMARRFSNVPGSYTSSLGFFVTGDTYIGKHGLSLVLEGLEEGINDKARERSIVMHAAEYATAQFAKEHGRLGRSLGCPAIPPDQHEEVIRKLSGGSCVFIYGSDEKYGENSAVIGSV